METEDVPVLIAGGSLVGLSTAVFLGMHGVKSLVVERHPGTAIHPRAALAAERKDLEERLISGKRPCTARGNERGTSCTISGNCALSAGSVVARASNFVSPAWQIGRAHV